MRATRRPGADAEIGGFGGLFDLRGAGYHDPVLVAATDGVGTKLKIAIETGILNSIGIDLVAMSVNDLVVQGAEPLIFLDYYATGKLDAGKGAAIVGGIAAGCRIAGAALIGGETAEMPGIYAGEDFDLAGFAVRRRRARQGTAPCRYYVRRRHSRIGLIRGPLQRLLVGAEARCYLGLAYASPAPFDRSMSLGAALLTPTRIYVKPLLSTIRATSAVKALAHITGGGITENLPRILSGGLAARIDLTRISVPAVFRWLAHVGRIERGELLRTFNCGIGMAVVASAYAADAVAASLTAAGETASRIGVIEPRRDAAVVYDGELDLRLVQRDAAGCDPHFRARLEYGVAYCRKPGGATTPPKS